jgi:hypothetical protein
VVTYVLWGAAGLASLALLAPALAVLLDIRGTARALTRQIRRIAATQGFLFRGEYPTGLVRVAAAGVMAVGLTVPAHALQDAGVPIVGGMPFLLYLAMAAGVFTVAGAVRIRSRFRAMIPPITGPALIAGILILEFFDSLLGLLPARGV